MASKTTPAQMRERFNAIKSANPPQDIMAELQTLHDDTNGFTDAAACAIVGENFDLLAELAAAVAPAAPKKAPSAKAPKAAASAPMRVVSQGDDDYDYGPDLDDNEPLAQPEFAGMSEDAIKKQLIASAKLKNGQTVTVQAGGPGPQSINGEYYAGKKGQIKSYNAFKHKYWGWYLAYHVQLEGSKQEDTFTPDLIYAGSKPNPIPKPKPQPTPAKLLEGMDDEGCRQLVRENDKAAREKRKQAEFLQFQNEQLKAGKTEAQVAALTPADMKQKRTISQVANAGAENLVHSITKHVLTKSAPLKGNADKLREKREQLEARAAGDVADFAKEKARAVAAELKEYADSLVDEPVAQ